MKWIVLVLSFILAVVVIPLLQVAYGESFFIFVVDSMFTGLIVASGLLIVQEKGKE